jgi:hypothetical protein
MLLGDSYFDTTEPIDVTDFFPFDLADSCPYLDLADTCLFDVADPCLFDVADPSLFGLLVEVSNWSDSASFEFIFNYFRK